MKPGSKGWCRNCGFSIITVSRNLSTFGVQWQVFWVHTLPDGRGGERACSLWTAQPKSHHKRELTLHQQLVGLRIENRKLKRHIEELESVHVRAT